MNPDQRKETEAAEDAPKSPYEKPAIIWQNAIDTKSISIGCGKIIPSGGPCSAGGQS